MRLADYADAPWLVPDAGVSCYRMIQRACGAAGFVPTVVAQATDFSVLTALVAAGAGVALVPRMALPAAPGRPAAGSPAATRPQPPDLLSLHPLVEPVAREVFALAPAGAARNPQLRRMLDLLAEAAGRYAAAHPGNAEEPRG